MAGRKMEIITPTKKIENAVKCGTTEQAYKIFRYVLNYEEYELRDQEHFWVMGIDAFGYVVCVYIAAIGADNMVTTSPVEIFDIAVKKQTKKIVLAHTHPNVIGEVTLSDGDFDFTNNLYHACLYLRMEVMDHIILGVDQYYSFLRGGDIAKIIASRTYKPYNQIKEVLDEEKDDAVIKGIEEGEQKKTIEIIKTMLKQNCDMDFISKIIKLEREEIDDIIIEIESGK